MSLATVYKNIVLIKSLGQVLDLGFPDGSNRYDENRPRVKCRKIVDPAPDSLKDLTDEVSQETNITIVNHRKDFFGIRSNCMAENA